MSNPSNTIPNSQPLTPNLNLRLPASSGYFISAPASYNNNNNYLLLPLTPVFPNEIGRGDRIVDGTEDRPTVSAGTTRSSEPSQSLPSMPNSSNNIVDPNYSQTNTNMHSSSGINAQTAQYFISAPTANNFLFSPITPIFSNEIGNGEVVGGTEEDAVMDWAISPADKPYG